MSAKERLKRKGNVSIALGITLKISILLELRGQSY
jgi:hypothetical protein